ncbi:hypothetical protein BOTBODRAFT_27094 [Botryobasidium botryosum FD-172 SS1]|uniref:Uncharacterized protein n=1 Tax=Botryobasidium botryosum (strain FD-172 SS1) TaxID=930990 RepID=A0A067N2A6_BOTB1|nr:hypothetical protein BOTBODRAFT_27094 [Botryobasidium botryosum FD-172 SS1]
MDDDFSFGIAVWQDAPVSPSQKDASPHNSIPTTSAIVDDSAFDDFDDFRDPIAASTSAAITADDDDFGDFGDFGDVDDNGFGDVGAAFPAADDFASGTFQPLPAAPDVWEPLRLDPLPSALELNERVQSILSPLWAHIDPEKIMTSEDIRQVEGLGQVLVTPESREVYHTLLQSPLPSFASRPINWTRSRIRRQHLISLGIPVNLDEVLPQASKNALPMMHITTSVVPRPMSAPPGPRSSPSTPLQRAGTPLAGTPRSGTPQPGQNSGRYTPQRPAASTLALGPKPKLDQAKADELLALSPESLILLPLPALQTHLDSLREMTATASSLLSHLLQTRDALQLDSETYNGLIAELVTEAQKMKGGKGRQVSGKRGSAYG